MERFPESDTERLLAIRCEDDGPMWDYVRPLEHPIEFYGDLEDAALFDSSEALMDFVTRAVREGFTFSSHEIVQVFRDEQGFSGIQAL